MVGHTASHLPHRSHWAGFMTKPLGSLYSLIPSREPSAAGLPKRTGGAMDIALRSKGFLTWLPGRAYGAREPWKSRKRGGSRFFDGVAMALIAQLHPLATILVAIFFAALRVGSTTMQAATGVPTSVSDIIQALVIVFTVAGLAMVKLPQFKAAINRLFGGKEAIAS